MLAFDLLKLNVSNRRPISASRSWRQSASHVSANLAIIYMFLWCCEHFSETVFGHAQQNTYGASPARQMVHPGS